MIEPYEFELRPEARKGLKRLDKPVQERVWKKIKWLAAHFDLVPHEPLSVDLKGLFKLRIGDYRVVYSSSIKQRLVTVHLIGHRREIYDRR